MGGHKGEIKNGSNQLPQYLIDRIALENKNRNRKICKLPYFPVVHFPYLFIFASLTGAKNFEENQSNYRRHASALLPV